VAEGAIALAETRLIEDRFLNIMTQGRLIGKEARICQTWTLASYYYQRDNGPKHIELLGFEEEIGSQVVGCGRAKSYHYCTTPIY